MQFGIRLTTVAIAIAALWGNPAFADETTKLETYRESARLFDAAASAARRGDVDEAKRDYELAIRADAAFVEAMVNLARLHVDRGDLGLAGEWLDRAEQQRPDYPKIAATRSLVALQADTPEAAIAHIERAHRLAPDDVEVGTNYGAMLIRRGLHAEARTVLQAVLRAQPDHAAAIFNLALVDDLTGQPDRAAHGYQRFLALTSFATPGREDVQRRVDALLGVPSVSSGPGRESDSQVESLPTQNEKWRTK